MTIELHEFLSDLAHVREMPPVFTPRDVACGGTLEEAEARVAWRLKWYERLIAAGWSPPAAVREQMERDRRLLTCAVDDRLVDQLAPPASAPVQPLTVSVQTSCGCAEVRQLREALVTRAVIERAKGVIMHAQGCNDEQAFRLLVRVSQRQHQKVREVAAEIVAAVEHRGESS